MAISLIWLKSGGLREVPGLRRYGSYMCSHKAWASTAWKIVALYPEELTIGTKLTAKGCN